MRKIASLLSLLMLMSVLAFAQTRTVTGRVTDEAGAAVPFATVTEVGTTNATQADAEGNFTITIRQGGRLSVTATGHRAFTVTPTGDTQNITLSRAEAELSEVVVTTAFGIRRSQRITPYSAQTIDREALTIIPQTNLNSALAGKVSGVQFRGQSPMKLGADDQGFLRLRGGFGITLQDGRETGPLYVVDGTPVNSFDINPNDVQEVTVLKGANATALFGERAANGAVVITTRKGGERNTIGIEVNQGVTADRVYILPKYQNLYAGGSVPDLMQYKWSQGHPEDWKALDGQFFHDYTDDASWGPRMNGQQYVPWYAWIPGTNDFGKTVPLVGQPNNVRDFWSTGITNVTNVSFSKGGQGFNTRISYTNNAIKGMLPNTRSDRNNLFTTASLDLGTRFVLAANVNYLNNIIRGQFDDFYANASSGSFNQWFHRNIDMDKMREYKDIRTPMGTLASWNFASNPDAGSAAGVYRGNYWYNPFSNFDVLDYKQTRDRLYGNASLTFNATRTLKFTGTVRNNTINTFYENVRPTILELSAVQSGELASYATGQTRSNELSYDLIGNYNNQFIDNRLVLNLGAGASLAKTNYRDVTLSTSGGLNVPDFYAISNSRNPFNQGNLRRRSETRSGFAFGDLEWNRLLAVNFAVRNDWYSTLPAGDNSLLSPSVGASFFFTELTKDVLPWLSYGKVFASWGKKPLSLDIYQNNFLYNVGADQWNGNFLMSTPNNFIDPTVSGALITTYEAGLDFRFIQNRYGLNITYYDETQQNPPLSIPTTGTTGFTTTLVNASRVERRGIEMVLSARPMVRRDFDWEINKTFGYIIDNPVVELLPGQDRLLLQGGAFGTRFARAFQVVGKDWGQLIGGGIKRNEEGLPLLTPSGMYVRDPDKEYGSIVPHLTGGLVNTLNFKSFTFNFNIDYQVGGKFFSLSDQWGHYSGLLEATAASNDRGWNVRDPLSVGGGVHVVGVQAADEKTPVDMYVDAQTYFHQFYGSQIAEPFVHSLTYVKMREISLGYQIPVSTMSIGRWFKGATVSVVARNPFLIYRETENYDPSEISNIYGENGQFPGTRSLGFNLKFNF